MAETRSEDARRAEIARALVAEDPALAHLRGHAGRIAFLSSEYEKRSHGRAVFAQCEKVPDKWKWAVPYDFAVTVYEPNAERLDGEQEKILLLHELMHVGVVADGNEETLRIVPHDVEDFREVIDRYGLDWSR